jgi:hypothetical protein
MFSLTTSRELPGANGMVLLLFSAPAVAGEMRVNRSPGIVTRRRLAMQVQIRKRLKRARLGMLVVVPPVAD